MALLPGVDDALGALARTTWVVAVVTNQPDVARGVLTEEEVTAQHQELAELAARAGGRIERFYYCPHHPDADLVTYRLDCGCRKPRPGMLQRAAADLGFELSSAVMVGDRMTDVEAGHRAGCGLTILIDSEGSKDRNVTGAPALDVQPGLHAANFPAAAAIIMALGDDVPAPP